MAIKYSGLSIQLREVDLKNKPEEMTQASEKSTVPILILDQERIIDESLDIMLWCLKQHDPQQWLNDEIKNNALQLITENDQTFKYWLDRYKYSDRYSEYPTEFYREKGELFLLQLDNKLKNSNYLLGNTVSIADVAIFPFIRQFAHVDKHWFDQAPYPSLQKWLSEFLNDHCFQSVMLKYLPWDSKIDNYYLF